LSRNGLLLPAYGERFVLQAHLPRITCGTGFRGNTLWISSEP
jgi:hypothetical protein